MVCRSDEQWQSSGWEGISQGTGLLLLWQVGSSLHFLTFASKIIRLGWSGKHKIGHYFFYHHKPHVMLCASLQQWPSATSRRRGRIIWRRGGLQRGWGAIAWNFFLIFVCCVLRYTKALVNLNSIRKEILTSPKRTWPYCDSKKGIWKYIFIIHGNYSLVWESLIFFEYLIISLVSFFKL